MSHITEVELFAVQGDDETYSLTFTTDGTTAVNLTGSTLTFMVVKSQDTPDANALITKTLTTFTDPTNGKTNLELTNTDTNIALGTYFYRMKWIDTSAKVKTIMKGKLSIEWAK